MIEKFCKDVQPGDGRSGLREHKAELSPNCHGTRGSRACASGLPERGGRPTLRRYSITVLAHTAREPPATKLDIATQLLHERRAISASKKKTSPGTAGATRREVARRLLAIHGPGIETFGRSFSVANMRRFFICRVTHEPVPARVGLGLSAACESRAGRAYATGYDQ